MIDILCLAVVAGVTYMVASDGPWGAAITLISVLFAGLLAMNFFEPVANYLQTNVIGSFEWQSRWDVIALLGLFSLFVTLFKMMGETLLPTYAEVNTLLYEGGRWGFGLFSGYVVMAILLTALHVAPLPREFAGFTPERNNFFEVTAPDRQWLAFTQYVSEYGLRSRAANGTTPIFDGPMFPRIPSDLGTNQVWSSFPMKYAARREMGGGGVPATTTTAPPVTPPSTSGTSSGATSGF